MIIVQDNPQGMPKVLTPSLDIQDTDHLKLDIQKWKNWITEKLFIEWEDFLQNQVPQMQEPPVQPNKWNLDIVKEVIASREALASIATAADSLILEKERVDCKVSVSLHDVGEARHIALTTIHVLHVHTTCLPG